MKHVVAFVAALVLFTAVPAVAAGKLTVVDTAALRENVLSLDHEWSRSGPTTTGVKLAVGKMPIEGGNLTLLGGAIGKRAFITIPGNASSSIYAGGYLFGQSITRSIPDFAERRTGVGVMSELGLRLRTPGNVTIDMGPGVTLPFFVRSTTFRGETKVERFPAPAFNWRLGLGFSW